MHGMRDNCAPILHRLAGLPAERLEDDELVLEPLAATDVSDVTAAVPAGERGVWGPVPGPLDEAAAAAFVKRHETGRRRGERSALTLRRSADGGFVGGAVLIVSAADEAELAYWIAPGARGRGYATRALISIADWALGRLTLDRIWLEIDPANAASLRVAAHAGFTPAAESPTVHERRRLADPPPGYSVRAARMDEAADVFALIRRSELHDLGETTVDLDELLSEWRSLPDFDLAHDTWVIVKPVVESVSTPDTAATPDNNIVGYAWFQNERDSEDLIGDHCVDPEERGRGLEAVLMDRLEDRARLHAAKSAGSASQMGVFAVSTHQYKPHLFRSRGYRKTREFLRLQLDLSPEPAAPEWPAGIEVRPFRRCRDEAAVHAALNDSFSEHFRDAPLSLADWEKLYFSNPRLDTGIWLVAWDGDKVAGACLNYIYSDSAAGHVEQLGVPRPWRCRGLGTSLLLASFRLLRDRGCRRATLGVDTENATGAARIYERAGMRPQWRTDFYEKTVRAPLGASPLGARRPPAART